MQTLSGRTCVFGGATGGDGVAAVKALCAGGMNVVMRTHNREAAERLCEEIKEKAFPGQCVYLCGGMEGKTGTEVYEDIAERFGSVDVIISNIGGAGKDIPMEEVTEEELLQGIGQLAGGAFGMLKDALPVLRRSRAPRAIFMSTVEGIHGGVHESFVQSVAKGAVYSLTLNAAARLAPEGITVNCISKGPIPRIEGLHEGDVDVRQMLSAVPMGRLGTPEDLAEAICFLASEESSFVTGQALAVSGGMELRP